MAASLFHDVYLRTTRALAGRKAELSLVYGNWYQRHDPDQGNLHYTSWLRADCAAAGLRIYLNHPGRRFQTRAAKMECNRSRCCLPDGNWGDCFLLLRHVLPLERAKRFV